MVSIYIPDGAAQERDKYREIWSFPEYSEFSPGGENVQRFLNVLTPPPAALVLDIGCGRGNAGLGLQAAGLTVKWLDITDAALDPSIPRDRFIQAPLWDDWANGRRWNYGFCCDVMEHIPPEYVMLCIERIVRACAISWFHIHNGADEFGKVIGEPLHLTVRPFLWWLIRLNTVGKVVDARDLCGTSLYIVEGEHK